MINVCNAHFCFMLQWPDKRGRWQWRKIQRVIRECAIYTESSFERSDFSREYTALYSAVTITKCYTQIRRAARIKGPGARYILFFRESKVSFIFAHASERARVSISGITPRASIFLRNFLADAIRRIPRAKKEPIPRQSCFLPLYIYIFLSSCSRLTSSHASSFSRDCAARYRFEMCLTRTRRANNFITTSAVERENSQI